MWHRVLGTILFLVCVTAAVIDLNDNNHEILANSELSLIYFGKDNCKYCNQLGPVYDQLGQYYDNDEHFQILKVDSTRNPKTKMNFGIRAYPTIYLYNHQSKRVKKFEEKRNLLSLVNFINDNTDTINKEIESNVKVITSLDDLTLKQQVVVFTLSDLKAWEEYEFPTHFMQQKSYEYNYDFGIAFVDQLADNTILEKYRIANFPSVIYFTNPDRMKVLKTTADKHTQGDKLTEKDFVAFLSNLNISEEDDPLYQFGRWFSLEQLQEYADHQQYELVDDIRKGFNFRHLGEDEDGDDDADYMELLGKLQL